MPLQYKVPGYVGNALLLLLSVAMLFSENVVVGLLLTALSALNLYLVYKLDQFSGEEGQLAHELEMAKIREQLLESQRHIAMLEAAAGAKQPTPESPVPKSA
jgi:hypothetical protein